jgi:hypothetical protein
MLVNCENQQPCTVQYTLYSLKSEKYKFLRAHTRTEHNFLCKDLRSSVCTHIHKLFILTGALNGPV